MLNLSSTQLRQAADLKEKIAALEAELAALFGGTAAAPVEAPAPIEAVQAPEPVAAATPGKRTMSPEHKAAIRAAQARRWAKHNAEKAKAAPQAARNGGMSAAGRARIAAAQKLRWAKVKAGK
jgi:hypothetical protein